MPRNLPLYILAAALGILMAFGIREAGAVQHEAELKVVRPDKGHGTGFHISNGLIITAAHVIQAKKRSYDVVTINGRVLSAELVWSSNDYDLAALRVEGADFKNSEVDCSTQPVGTAITAVGYPLNLPYLAHFGKVSNNQPASFYDWLSVIFVDVTVGAGMSGAPIRVEGTGKVAGVLVGGMSQSKTSGFALVVPAKVLCGMLGLK